jgi:hypothetical protein
VADAERLCACLGLCERGLCPVGNGPQSPVEPRTGEPARERVPGTGRDDLRAAVARYTDRLWHTSQHGKCPIWLAGRMQDDVNALRAAVGLSEFGWNYWVPDEEAGRCTVHVEDECAGQHTHNPPVYGKRVEPEPIPVTMTVEQAHALDPTHEWYPGDGCPVCVHETNERRYAHLTEDERCHLALAARSHADVQTRTAELWRNNAKNDTLAAAHLESAARWREIADGFHADPWGNGS